MTPKELKRLAEACRKAGIKHYRDASGLEFTLTDDAPVSTYKKRSAMPKIDSKASNSPDIDKIVDDGWDTLSEEQKLFYSVQDPLYEDSENKGTQ